MRLYHAIFTVVASALASACTVPEPKQQPARAELPPAGPDGMYRVEFPSPKPAEDRIIAVIATRIRTACELTPHFAFASSEPLAQDQVALAALAACLESPEVRDQAVLLIGHADVRGTGAYNHELGRQRAARVKELLVSAGVDAARIRVLSAGERKAKGMLPAYSHGHDRRVDVRLEETPPGRAASL